MRRPLRTPWLIATFAASTIAAASAQEPSGTAASLARVRAALNRPPSKLALNDRPPDFTVHIETRPPMADIFDVPAWATDPVGWQPPGLGFDFLSLFRSVAKSAAAAKRGHDLRLAREDVQRSVAAYCAALPAADGPSASGDWPAKAAQICSTSPAIR
jgi:hypothetical protein